MTKSLLYSYSYSYRKIVSDKSDGCFLNITNTLTSGTTSKTHVRFLHVAADLSGDRIIGGDHHGNYYLFDIDKNRFTLLFSIGVSCTAISWNNFRYNEVLIALSNYEVCRVICISILMFIYNNIGYL